LSLVEWLDNGDFVQRAWVVNEATVRKLRALLGPPKLEQLLPPEALGAMQQAAIDAGSVMLTVPVELLDGEWR
jgi:hypothetical protein